MKLEEGPAGAWPRLRTAFDVSQDILIDEQGRAYEE